jgi:hypothetical protein
MPNTYTELRQTVVGTATPSVTFDLTGISGYTDLVIVINSKLASTTSTYMNFNGDTAGNYSLTRIYGNGSTAVSDRIGTNLTGIDVSYTGSGDGNNVIINVMNYSNSTTNKTSLNRWNTAGSTGYVGANVSLWRNTAAITSITFSNSVNFSVGSTFSLYGIANADQGAAKATGGIITEDSQYWYHTFGASGAFTPKQALTCDVLVVAGGGGAAGSDGGGGGGAGGLQYFSAQSISTNQNVTIGAGGAGTNAYINGVNGVNTTFGALAASIGGGAGGYYQQNGVSGGSGGGGGRDATSLYTGGGRTVGQGNIGGAASTINNYVSASGGGGAGAAGGPTSSAGNASIGDGGPGGAGGAGLNTYSAIATATSTGVNGFYAGGGGGAAYLKAGGVGGAGGGGAGGNGTAGSNAIANTGSGGGGGLFGTGGSGGSGIVIVRYAK